MGKPGSDGRRWRRCGTAGDDAVLLAPDGKTFRRSHDTKKNRGKLHSVSCRASELELSLGQLATGR
ncbi:MAG: hypothetical protein U0935_16350 [Pirellulales bacterium]